MSKLKSLAFIWMLGAMSFLANAQSECSKVLKKAEKLYDQGSLEQLSHVLESCLEDGFTKDEKSKAYKLLCMNYLYDDNNEKAEETLLSLLHENPEYYVDRQSEKIEFLKLYDKFRTSPSYSLSLAFGVNQTFVEIGEPFGIHNIETTSNVYSNSGLGITFQAAFNKYLKPNLMFGLEADYKTSSYGNFLDLDYTTVQFTESFSTLDVPLYFRYELGKGKLRPFVKLGGGLNVLLTSKAELVREYSESGVRPQSDQTGPEVDLKDQRVGLNYFAFGGVGVKYKIPMAYLFLDIRYNYGLSNSVNVENRYANKELTYKYYYVDDNFFVSNAIVSLGYERLFYVPKKKKVKK